MHLVAKPNLWRNILCYRNILLQLFPKLKVCIQLGNRASSRKQPLSSQPLFHTTTAESPVISSQRTFLGASISPVQFIVTFGPDTPSATTQMHFSTSQTCLYCSSVLALFCARSSFQAFTQNRIQGLLSLTAQLATCKSETRILPSYRASVPLGPNFTGTGSSPAKMLIRSKVVDCAINLLLEVLYFVADF